MKEYPILFSGEMVRSILAGKKTQTRRVIKSEWSRCLDLEEPDDVTKAINQCPYGQPGDRLWVRETAKLRTITATSWKVSSFDLYYKADDGLVIFNNRAGRYAPYKRIGFTPSIHMPRWASRINLEIVNIRVERVQDINLNDMVAEGIQDLREEMSGVPCVINRFQKLWNSINAKRGYSWEVNPWVWVIEFKREEEK